MGDMASHKTFDGDWKLGATLRPNGTIQTAPADHIIAAQLLLIRDEARKQTRALTSIEFQLARLNRFFLALGSKRVATIIGEQYRIVNRNVARRRNVRVRDLKKKLGR